MSITGQDTLKTRRTLSVGGKEYDYFSLEAAEAAGIGAVGRLPFSLKVLLENLLRRENGRTVTVDDVKAVARNTIISLWKPRKRPASAPSGGCRFP